ncbi:hypothetical protein GH714_026211 [Hevea brasiliensis]|uniref:Longin domain-containing protein n=1 Tax=Hevea brasiliensis TaxID=3981 RepID=A0A6A6KXE2_HEVBR|nr:hypothetical protein GH714_026211 [Hevea brasiliensis]
MSVQKVICSVKGVGSDEKFPLSFSYMKPYLNGAMSSSSYCVVAVESVGRQVPIAFLERIKEDFTKKYGGGKAATAVANSLNKEFGPKLKEQMQYCVDHPEEVLDRGEKIELLVDKTENLRSQAQDFRQQGTKMRRKMWLQNMKIKLIVLEAMQIRKRMSLRVHRDLLEVRMDARKSLRSKDEDWRFQWTLELESKRGYVL